VFLGIVVSAGGTDEGVFVKELPATYLAFRSQKESHQRYEALLRLVAFRTPEQIEKYRSDMDERYRKLESFYTKMGWEEAQESVEGLHRKDVEEPYAMLLKLVEAERRRT
jgi:hypothetical protein